jgi:hypothetical protein
MLFLTERFLDRVLRRPVEAEILLRLVAATAAAGRRPVARGRL